MKKILTGVVAGALCISLTIPAAANQSNAGDVIELTELQPSQTVEKTVHSKIWGTSLGVEESIITVATDSSYFNHSETKANITSETIIIDAATGLTISQGAITESSLYMYLDHQYEGFAPNAIAIAANLPMDLGAPLLVTVKDVQFTDEEAIVTTEKDTVYTITRDTYMDRAAGPNKPMILSLPVLEDLQPRQRVLMVTDYDQNVVKCIITSHSYSAPVAIENLKLSVDGNKINFPVCYANGEMYLPLKQSVKDLGYEITWNQETKTASIIINDIVVPLEIGNEHYLYENMTYVSRTFFETMLDLNVEDIENVITISTEK